MIRSSLEVSERLARRSLNSVEGYWSATRYSDQRVSLAAGDTWVIPVSFSQILIDCDAELSLKFRWMQSSTQIEVAINQLLIMTGPLTSAAIRNAAANGTPDAFVRIVTT